MKEKYRILVAEDEEYNDTLLKLIFEKEGLDVLRARDGKEAIDIVRKDRNIKLVLMDIKMPVMNGLDATREIKKINNKIPVIAVTAYAMKDDRSICLDAGCDDIITKPINRQNLVRTAFTIMNNL